MPRYRLTVAYDGTDFCGWQKQAPIAERPVRPEKLIERTPEGMLRLRTVQEIVERAVARIVREPVEVLGASRTDAGVHARGQVAAFTTAEGWPPERGTEPLRRAINSELPDDVLVASAAEAPADFDPVGGATSKKYTYSLHVSRDRPLFDRRYTHQVWVDLDIGAMARAAERFVGEHDFAAFAAAGHGRLTTIRRVLECGVVDAPATGTACGSRRVLIDVVGTGFLYNMVRIIAGTLVEVGRGRMTPDDVSDAIAGRDRRLAGPTLGPEGLCLEWVRYGLG